MVTKEHIDVMDKHILEINLLICEVCKKDLYDDVEDKDELSTSDEISNHYNNGMIFFVRRFLQISEEFRDKYIDDCGKLGEETHKLK